MAKGLRTFFNYYKSNFHFQNFFYMLELFSYIRSKLLFISKLYFISIFNYLSKLFICL